MDDFFRFSKKIGFGVFLFHPTVVSVLLSASVERCFVSRMRDFYPSITKPLLMKAIQWAKKHVDFTQEEIDIILQARSSVLIHQDQPWTKKGEEPFDVTMGAYDGAEVCELVGLYLLSLLAALPYGKAVQYRDDGLMLLRASSRQAEVKKKEVAAILKSTGISITISAN